MLNNRKERDQFESRHKSVEKQSRLVTNKITNKTYNTCFVVACTQF